MSFLFHLKSSVRSEEIQNFILTFWSQKNGLIRKTRSISKFLTSQPGKQAIAIHTRKPILKDHAQNIIEKIFPYSFLKKSKLSISLDQ